MTIGVGMRSVREAMRLDACDDVDLAAIAKAENSLIKCLESMPGTLVYCHDGELHWGHYTPDETSATLSESKVNDGL